MSSTQTRRPVLTGHMAEAYTAELNQSLLRSLTECSALSVESSQAMGEAIDAGTSLSRLLAARAAPMLTDQQVWTDLVGSLQAEAMLLEGLAAGAALPTGLADDDVRRIDELVASTKEAPVDRVGELTEQLVASVGSLEERVLGALCDQRAAELLPEVMAETLRRAGLVDVQVQDEDGLVVLTGRGEGSLVAEVEVEVAAGAEGPAVVLTVDDPADRVHERHPDAQDDCESSAELAKRIHLVLPEVLGEVGMAAGRVHAVVVPTRGAVTRPIRRRADQSKGRTVGGAS